jgi:triosephosphate isomerase
VAAWPRRPRLVAGNWKMHKTPVEAVALAREVVELLRARGAVQVAVCPPFPALDPVGAVLRDTGIHLGGQNVHAEPQGAFTGEASAIPSVGTGWARTTRPWRRSCAPRNATG